MVSARIRRVEVGPAPVAGWRPQKQAMGRARQRNLATTRVQARARRKRRCPIVRSYRTAQVGNGKVHADLLAGLVTDHQ
ncbi:hypothetical protein D3C78_1301590 [compost metagenome]